MSSAPRGLAPREGLELELMKLGCTGPPLEPCHRPQAGKSGYPRSQNADNVELGDNLRPAVLVVLVLLHQNGNLWLIRRDSAPAACLPYTEEETGALRPPAPAWPWSSWLTSAEPRDLKLA